MSEPAGPQAENLSVVGNLQTAQAIVDTTEPRQADQCLSCLQLPAADNLSLSWYLAASVLCLFWAPHPFLYCSHNSCTADVPPGRPAWQALCEKGRQWQTVLVHTLWLLVVCIIAGLFFSLIAFTTAVPQRCYLADLHGKQYATASCVAAFVYLLRHAHNCHVQNCPPSSNDR